MKIKIYTENTQTKAEHFLNLNPEEKKRLAVKACAEWDIETLWWCVESYLYFFGEAGGKASKHTLRTYKRSIEDWCIYSQNNAFGILQADINTGARFVRHLEQFQSTSTVRVKIAGIKMLYRALRWLQATKSDPLSDVRAGKDKTAAWDKRTPYTPEDIQILLQHADTLQTVLVLLGAHAGLRVSEVVALKWLDVNLATGWLTVKAGKGGKLRRVPLSRALKTALEQLKIVARAKDGKVIGLSDMSIRRSMQALCAVSGVEYRAYHAFRHSAGTRVYQQTKDLLTTANMLGHSSLETSKIYAKWSEHQLQDIVKEWD